jgi:hypothetical protein
MTGYKATPGQWIDVEFSHRDDSHTACILELRSRIEQLEAQANHFGGINKMVPPPVATDEELRAAWNVPGTNLEAFRAIYNLGVAHGQASSREVAKHAPVAGGLVERVKLAIDIAVYDEDDHQWNEARAAILEVAKWLRDQQWLHTAADLLEQEAGR